MFSVHRWVTQCNFPYKPTMDFNKLLLWPSRPSTARMQPGTGVPKVRVLQGTRHPERRMVAASALGLLTHAHSRRELYGPQVLLIEIDIWAQLGDHGLATDREAWGLHWCERRGLIGSSRRLAWTMWARDKEVWGRLWVIAVGATDREAWGLLGPSYALTHCCGQLGGQECRW